MPLRHINTIAIGSYSDFREQTGYQSYIHYQEDSFGSWELFLREKIFVNGEVDEIIHSIKENLSVRLWHGCRIENFKSYKAAGLEIFSAKSANKYLINFARDEEEKRSIEQVIKGFTQDNNGCYFCPSLESLLKFGGVYVVFGSEYQLKVLNGVNSNLRERLFRVGVPSILVFDIPLKLIDQQQLFTYQIELWSKKHLQIDKLRTFHERKLKDEFFRGEIKVNKSVDFSYFNKVFIPQKKLIKVNTHFDSSDSAKYSFDQICEKSELKKLEDFLSQAKISYELI